MAPRLGSEVKRARTIRPITLIAVGIALTTGSVRPGATAEWGTIIAGTSTKESVTARYGQPTKNTTQKVEGYATTEWIYEGRQAPPGMRRLVIDFGLLTPSGYRPELVRLFKLEPKPGVFTRDVIVSGWGEPARVGREGDLEVFFYEEGLLVHFESNGDDAKLMTFTPRQSTDRSTPPRP